MNRHAPLAVLVVLAAIGVGCGRPTELPIRADLVTDFRTLYDENCAGCHGADGRRGVAQPLHDAAYLGLVSDAQLRDVISRGVRGTPMTAFARSAGGMLTDKQVAALVDGMRRSWSDSQRVRDASSPVYSSDEALAQGIQPGDVDRGAAAYGIYCIRCHGGDARGGPKAGSIVDKSFLELTSDQALRTTIIAGRVDENIPGWRDYVSGQPMNNQQVADIVAWVSSHRGSHD